MSEAKHPKREWSHLMMGLADSVIKAPEKHVLEELHEEGIDVARTAADVRAKLLGTVKEHYQQRRAELRPAATNEKRPSIAERLRKASISPMELWKRVKAKHPQALTAQAREETELTDEDVIKMLAKLDRLGALDDLLP